MMRCQTTVEAAEQLGISQPAVSNGLRQLERELGITLFERAHRRLEPTAEALSLYEEIRPLFGVLRSFSLRARDIRQGKSGRIRIVATPAHRPHRRAEGAAGLAGGAAGGLRFL